MDSLSTYERRNSASSTGDKAAREASANRRGGLATAVPHHRSLFKFTLGLRFASLLVSIAMFIAAGVLTRTVRHADSIFGVMALAFPTALACFSWTTVDLVMLLLGPRASKWCGNRKGHQRRNQRGPASNFRWGPPAVHITAHLMIWASGIIMTALFWSSWLFYIHILAQDDLAISRGEEVMASDPPLPTKAENANMWIMPFLQTMLIAVHFSLFVLAAVATDDKVRAAKEIVYLPRDQAEKQTVTALPSTLWDVFFPEQLPLAVAMSQYVRFVAVEQQSILVPTYYEKPPVSHVSPFR